MSIPSSRPGADKTIAPDRENAGLPEAETEADSADDISVQDWIEAERSRPTLPDETADGLDDMDEEIRRQAEDLPLDIPRRGR